MIDNILINMLLSRINKLKKMQMEALENNDMPKYFRIDNIINGVLNKINKMNTKKINKYERASEESIKNTEDVLDSSELMTRSFFESIENQQKK